MNIQQAYNNWAEQYDTNVNKTRDLEGQALRTALSTPWTFADRKYDLVTFSLVLEHIDHLDHIFRETGADRYK